jgi:hypothetical protein
MDPVKATFVLGKGNFVEEGGVVDVIDGPNHQQSGQLQAIFHHYKSGGPDNVTTSMTSGWCQGLSLEFLRV